MKILIDIGHPAHVHLFKNFAQYMIKRGNSVLFTCRDKEFEIHLLEHYGFEYHSFGKKFNTTIGKLFGLLKFDLQEILVGFKFKPDLFLSAGSMYSAHASFILRKPHFAFEDTFNMEQVNLYLPFTEKIFASKIPSNVQINSQKVILYKGYHELAYLHPNWFKNENSIYKDLGIEENEKFIIIRFVSWNASHDRGQNGIKMEEKKELIHQLSKHAKIFISSEGTIPKEWEQYQIKVAPYKIHTLMAKATLFVGEGATMASECAMLGTPAIYVNSLDAETIKEQEKYGLLYHYKEGKEAIQKSIELLTAPQLKETFKQKRAKMLSEKIDLTQLLINYVTHYFKGK